MKIITGKTNADHVNSEDDRGLHAGTFGKGSYVLNVGTKLKATIESSNTIRLDSGDLVHQGTHARIPYGTYDTATIDNGQTGFQRKDLIVARYERNGGYETMSIITIKGQPASSSPVAPDYEDGNILEGADISDMPLYEVLLDGVNIANVTQLFTVSTGLDDVYRKDECIKNSDIKYISQIFSCDSLGDAQYKEDDVRLNVPNGYKLSGLIDLSAVADLSQPHILNISEDGSTLTIGHITMSGETPSYQIIFACSKLTR